MTVESDPRCVYTAENPVATEIIAGLLKDLGYPTETIRRQSAADINVMSGGLIEDDIMDVFVINPEHAEPARVAIEEQKAAMMAIRERHLKRAERTGTVTAVCEDCGTSSEWPASAMGTTETCPHCGGYMDVPDPDENWDDVDFEGEEPEGE